MLKLDSEIHAIILISSFGHFSTLVSMTTLKTFNAVFLNTTNLDLTQCCTEPSNISRFKKSKLEISLVETFPNRMCPRPYEGHYLTNHKRILVVK